MRILNILFIAGFICQISLAQERNITLEEEPKATFIVTIDGKEYAIEEGETAQLDSICGTPNVSIKIGEVRKFDSGSLSFDYPKSYVYEYTKDFGYKNWTLSGNSCIVMYFEFDAYTPLSLFVSDLVDQFGKRNCEVEEKKIHFGEKILYGSRINIDIVGEKLVLDLYEINLSDDKTRFIAFQDSLNEYYKTSDECRATVDMVKNSIVYE